jgi:PAS domain S-box-containing protein
MTQRSLASAMLRRFLLVFLSVITLALTIRAVSEYKAAHAQALTELSALAETFAPAAASAIWDYQNDVLQAIARGIGNHLTVESVVITDSKGNVLADWHAGTVVAAAQPISVVRELKRTSNSAEGKSLGSLKIATSTQRVTANLQAQLLQSGLWLAGLLLIILGILWLLIQRLVTRPLSRFSHTVELLSVRNHSQHFVLPAAKVREISSLQTSFTTLMQAVAESHAQISRNNAELGLRVAARTAELNEQAQHTRTILDHILDAVITIDDQGLIQSFNPAAETTFGYAAADVIGRNANILLPFSLDGTPNAFLLKYLRTYNAAQTPDSIEIEGAHKDGHSFAMELKISAITRHERILYVAMARDISERKRIEQMKSEFVSTVSHELRTPLTSISGVLGLLDGGVLGELSEEARQMISIARRNSLQLEILINDLLDMEKLAAGKMRFEISRQALAPIIQEAIETTAVYDSHREVSIIAVEPLPAVHVAVDRQRLLQALRNFLSNAVKFSPPQGCVEVFATVIDEQVRISVRDHGEGVPDTFKANIFQKFAQADSTDTRQKGGTGLGLAITKAIAEQMQGSVGCDSVPGEGATFWLLLPVQPI